jgi:hypothetical protein
MRLTCNVKTTGAQLLLFLPVAALVHSRVLRVDYNFSPLRCDAPSRNRLEWPKLMERGFLLLDAESEHTVKELVLFLQPVETADVLFDLCSENSDAEVSKYESPLFRTTMNSCVNAFLYSPPAAPSV